MAKSLTKVQKSPGNKKIPQRKKIASQGLIKPQMHFSGHKK